MGDGGFFQTNLNSLTLRKYTICNVSFRLKVGKLEIVIYWCVIEDISTQVLQNISG